MADPEESGVIKSGGIIDGVAGDGGGAVIRGQTGGALAALDALEAGGSGLESEDESEDEGASDEQPEQQSDDEQVGSGDGGSHDGSDDGGSNDHGRPNDDGESNDDQRSNEARRDKSASELSSRSVEKPSRSSPAARYVPPGARTAADGDAAAIRRLRGLLNRLSEQVL